MEKKIKLNEKVIIFGTGKVDDMPKDVEVSVHPVLAKKLISQGKATDKKGKE